MNITLEQSLASAVRYILENDVEGVHPYFENIPEAFMVPSVYFPVPYIEGSKATLASYRNDITFEARILAGTDWDAEARAASLRDSIMLDNLHIPIYAPDGTDTGKSLRLLEPYHRRVEMGVVSLYFRILDYFKPSENRQMANRIIVAWNGVISQFRKEEANGSQNN